MARPTKYTDDMPDKLSAFGTKGEGVVEACQMLGIVKDTFYHWDKSHPEFSDAIKMFRQNSQVWWERAGRVGTMGKSPGFNATSYIYNMKNRFSDDWKDRKEHNHISTDRSMSPIPSDADPDDLRKARELIYGNPSKD